MARASSPKVRRVLVLDIGGSHVGLAISPGLAELRIPSDSTMTPRRLISRVRQGTKGRAFDVVSIGYPGLVVHGRIVRDPHNLGPGWVGFDFAKAFRHPTRLVNDAAMQALGSYQGGRMLFLGLGTGLGSAMIVDGELEPMEIAHLPYKKGKTYEDVLGEAALLRRGRKKWTKEVFTVVEALSAALEPDYVVLGGGNVRKLKSLPPRCRRGSNRYSFRGGVRLWADRTARPGRRN
ncbi:MAG: ROK family protein [Thermoplasmata archaeon]|nr:ROK family protein [Thermoplasmata archaeon]